MSPREAASGHAPSRGIAMGASLLCLAGSILVAVLPASFLARL